MKILKFKQFESNTNSTDDKDFNENITGNLDQDFNLIINYINDNDNYEKFLSCLTTYIKNHPGITTDSRWLEITNLWFNKYILNKK